MAHPIAGENQFPFQIGGFLVDSAKIDGRTFSKELYIHKQSSSFMFDLIEATTGEIFKNVHISWKDETGKNLNYDDTPLYIASVLPERTFSRKVQDLSRNIYGFLVMIHGNKVKVSTGDYIFYDIHMPRELSGVTLVPQSITVKKGEVANFNVKFIPGDFPNKHGTWSAKNARILRSTGTMDSNNMISFEAMEVGESPVSFTPDANDMLSAGGYVYVIDNDEPDKDKFSSMHSVIIRGFNPDPEPIDPPNDRYFENDEFTVKVLFTPSTYVPTEPLRVEPDVDGRLIYLGTTDNINYKFKIADNQYDGIPIFFSLHHVDVDGQEYSNSLHVKVSGTVVSEGPSILQVPRGCRPNQKIYAYTEYNYKKLSWTSTNEHVLSVTGPGEFTGVSEGITNVIVGFPNGDTETFKVTVSEQCADVITISNPSEKIYSNGDSEQFVLEVYPPECAEFYKPTWKVSEFVNDEEITITPDGLMTVHNVDEYVDVISVFFDIFSDYQYPPLTKVNQLSNLYVSRLFGNSTTEAEEIKSLVFPIDDPKLYIEEGVTYTIEFLLGGSTGNQGISGDKYIFEIQGEGNCFNAVRPRYSHLHKSYVNAMYEVTGVRPGEGKLTFSVKDKPEIKPYTLGIVVYDSK